MSINLRSLESTKQFYANYLADYVLVTTKRRMMTKEIIAHKKFIDEVTKALNRTDQSQGWYLGERYYPHHLDHYQKELKLMLYIRDCI